MHFELVSEITGVVTIASGRRIRDLARLRRQHGPGRWRKWLSRRGGRSYMSWPEFHRLEERYTLPAAIAVHSIYRRATNP